VPPSSQSQDRTGPHAQEQLPAAELTAAIEGPAVTTGAEILR
jgi:hypothetical protein